MVGATRWTGPVGGRGGAGLPPARKLVRSEPAFGFRCALSNEPPHWAWRRGWHGYQPHRSVVQSPGVARTSTQNLRHSRRRDSIPLRESGRMADPDPHDRRPQRPRASARRTGRIGRPLDTDETRVGTQTRAVVRPPLSLTRRIRHPGRPRRDRRNADPGRRGPDEPRPGCLGLTASRRLGLRGSLEPTRHRNRGAGRGTGHHTT